GGPGREAEGKRAAPGEASARGKPDPAGHVSILLCRERFTARPNCRRQATAFRCRRKRAPRD
ncbi:MAG: hypothetical protein WBQ75_23450, partial [Acetobacteraceae bacterium]